MEHEVGGKGARMDPVDALPDSALAGGGSLSREFQAMGVATFREACRRVRQMPYGYNPDRDDPLALFHDGYGTCTTKHMAVGLLARELGLPVGKAIGIYPMTEALVTGAGRICRDFGLPYIPVLHCFLVSGDRRVDLTEGNRNGKNGPIRDFLYTEAVAPDISAKDEYRRYRSALQQVVLNRPELSGVALKTLLAAREQALALLKANIDEPIHPNP